MQGGNQCNMVEGKFKRSIAFPMILIAGVEAPASKYNRYIRKMRYAVKTWPCINVHTVPILYQEVEDLEEQFIIQRYVYTLLPLYPSPLLIP